MSQNITNILREHERNITIITTQRSNVSYIETSTNIYSNLEYEFPVTFFAIFYRFVGYFTILSVATLCKVECQIDDKLETAWKVTYVE
jgi:hypothetical protein